MTPEQQPFLRKIAENAEDDLPRLIYADWLEEQGDPRGEFIRLQCQAAANPDQPTAARERQWALYMERRQDWLAPLIEAYGEKDFPFGTFPLIRGFVDAIYYTTTTKLKQLQPALSECAPGLLKLTIVDLTVENLEVLDAPQLNTVRELYVYRTALNLELLEKLTTCRLLRHLRVLHLPYCGLGNDGVGLLAGAEFEQLRRLNLDSNDITAHGLERLATAPWLAGLESLSLTGNQIAASGQVAVEGLTALGNSRWLSRLKQLDLRQCGLTEKAMQAFRNTTGFNGLQRLDLINNSIGPAGAAALAESPGLSQLTDLDCWNGEILDAGAQSLAASPYLRNLKQLYLGHNQLTDAGFQALVNSPLMDTVERLYLVRNQISDASLQALARSPHVLQLRDLDLRANQIGDGGIAALSKATHLPNLRTLALADNKLTDAGLAPFLNRPLFSQLQWLDLRANSFTSEFITATKSAHPTVHF